MKELCRGYLLNRTNQYGVLSGFVNVVIPEMTSVVIFLENTVLKKNNGSVHKFTVTVAYPLESLYFEEITDCVSDGDKFTFTHARFGTFTVSPV